MSGSQIKRAYTSLRKGELRSESVPSISRMSLVRRELGADSDFEQGVPVEALSPRLVTASNASKEQERRRRSGGRGRRGISTLHEKIWISSKHSPQ